MEKCWERSWSRKERRHNWFKCVSEEAGGTGSRSRSSSREGGRDSLSSEAEGRRMEVCDPNQEFSCVGMES